MTIGSSVAGNAHGSRFARIAAWHPSRRQLVGVYAIGFAACWLTFWLGLRQTGADPYVSPLYGFLLLFEEALRDLLNRIPQLRPTFYPPALFSYPVLAASALVAEIFVTGAALLRSDRKPLRWAGIALLLVLALAAFSWTRIPPLPRVPGVLLLPFARFFTMPS